MPVNPWLSGANAIISTLAEREAQALAAQEAEAARQAEQAKLALDERRVAVQEQQAEQAHNRDLYRVAMDGTNLAMAQRQAEEAKEAEAAQNAARAQAYQAWLSASDPTEKQMLALQASQLGVPAQMLQGERPDTRSLEVQLADALANGDSARATSIRRALSETAEARRAPERPAAPRADDPELPSGIRQGLDTLAIEGHSFEDAVRYLRQEWPRQQTIHPQASLAEAEKYLLSLYDQRSQIPDPGAEAPVPRVAASEGVLPATQGVVPGTGTGARNAAAPPPAAAAPTQHPVGTIVTYQDGSKFRITGYTPDGQPLGEPVQ